jgi:hypothetical protein
VHSAPCTLREPCTPAASAMHPNAAPLSLAQASAWSPLTSAHWAAEAAQPSNSNPTPTPTPTLTLTLTRPSSPHPHPHPNPNPSPNQAVQPSP